MDFDQTQAIYDYEEEEEEKVEQDKAHPTKKEAAHLKVFSQQGFKETIFPVFQGDNVIGRDGKCDITIPIKALSKKHACIEVQRDLHLIYDKESKNKTKKGKSFLKPTVRYELKHGDMLTLGDVKCQYIVGLDTEEDEEDETGSETGSESMLPEVNTEEEPETDQPVVPKEVSNKSDVESAVTREDLLPPVKDCRPAKLPKDDEEAYAADTDSDTDEERPLAVAAMATVLYSSEDEQETPARQKAANDSTSKQNASMEGQTLAFGLGCPDNVFRNRDSSSSTASHAGQTASIPPTLMLSSESDIQSDGKADLSSDNKQTSPKHLGARGSGTQPTCEPTLLYGSESDDGSPIKRPRHPEARASDKQEPSCAPTLLYGSESEDVSPIKKPRHPKTSNEPAFLYESDSEEGSGKAPDDSDSKRDDHQTSEIPGSSSDEPVEGRTGDKQEETAVKEAEATLLYAAAEMSSTDDEAESETNVDDKPAPYTEPTRACNTEESREEEANDVEDNLATDEYGQDSATQPYAPDSNFETESEPIPFVGRNAAGKSDTNQAGEPSDVEATQAYCAEEDDDDEEEGDYESEPIPFVGRNLTGKSDANQPAKPSDLEAMQAYCAEEEEGSSDSSDSQPLPIGPTAGHDDVAATLAYGLEATQAYHVTEKDDDSDSEDDRGDLDNNAKTLAYDLQATQAYGAGASDDNDDDDKRESCNETVGEQSSKTGNEVERSDANQPTIADGLEATQAYGADETDDEDSEDQVGGSRGGDQGRGDEATLAYGLAATLPYGGVDDGSEDDDDDKDNEGDNKRDHKVAEPISRQENQATLAYGLEETQAYDDDNIETDSAPLIEATQAYGIEEPSDKELEEQTVQSKLAAKKTTNRRVAFASASLESTEVAEVDETEVGVSLSGKENKGKPSTSAAVEVQEDLPDSEVLIQPRSRSTRGRKKPVIKESQEDGNQEAPRIPIPSEGKSKASDKLGKGQSEPVVTSSSAGTVEQIEGADETAEDEAPVTKPPSRKGRRGAMRVTIEPEEPEEEDVPELSTRRRGRKGAKVADEQQKDNNKGTATATAGCKRGQQTAKTTSVAKSSEEVSVEVEETPAAKSRRGRRGKMAQTETVSVSETPLHKPTDITAVTEATDSEHTAATVVETPNVRRGGRGKGRKGVATKEIAQAVEAQDEEISVESQPEAVVEATPSRGKGRGKGRGKKNQTSAINETVVAETHDPEVSTISDQIQPQLDTATPARGKGRGRGRGKKAQPEAEVNVPDEPPAVQEEELQAPESPVVSAASKVKGRGRQGRGKKTQPSTMELESTEETSQTLSIPDSSEGSQPRKGRGRGKVSRESSEQGPSSDLEVQETPSKKSRRGKEPAVSHSPSLRQGKHASDNTPKVIFTGLVDKQGEKVVTSLGGELVDDIHSCTHLVTDKVRRTVKFLCGLSGGQIIVLPSWLDACKRTKSFVDTSPFLVKDKDAEKQYKFDLQRSHEVALNQGLLEGYKVHVTKKVKPEPSQMKDIIKSAKGEFLSSMPRGKEDRLFVISCEEDRSVCKKPLEAGIPVVSAEVLLTGVLRQQLDLEEHRLFADEMSDISQDTASSSGQSKRRREPSEAGASSSTAETKPSGSKRRKR